MAYTLLIYETKFIRGPDMKITFDMFPKKKHHVYNRIGQHIYKLKMTIIKKKDGYDPKRRKKSLLNNVHLFH